MLSANSIGPDQIVAPRGQSFGAVFDRGNPDEIGTTVGLPSGPALSASTSASLSTFSSASLDIRASRATARLDGPAPSVVDVRRSERGLLSEALDFGSKVRDRSIAAQVVDLRTDAMPAGFDAIGERSVAAAIAGFKKNEAATIENILLVAAAKFVNGIQSGLRRLSQG